MKTPAILLLILSVLCRTVLVSTKSVKHTVEEWNKYRSVCLLRMSTDPTPHTGLFCSRMFDMYACWPEGVPNTTVKVPCPWYLPWYNQGTPVLFVVPWIIVRYLYENTRCWEINENMAYWWIIRTPILLAILVNFFIFIRIIQILISKLKACQMRYTDYKFRLAKSTLTLIPLLGIHEVVFAVMSEEQTEGILRNINLFFELFFNSFQGLLVAILYCFVNKEVQSEIKKKWQRWKLGVTVLDDLRNTGSNAPQGGTGGGQYHHDPPCQPDCPQEDTHNLSSDASASGPHAHPRPHHHPGAKKGKAYCYISARKQVLNGLDGSPLGNGGGEGAIKYSESYC